MWVAASSIRCATARGRSVFGGGGDGVVVAGGHVAEQLVRGRGCSRSVVVAETGGPSRRSMPASRSSAVGGIRASGRIRLCGSPSLATLR